MSLPWLASQYDGKGRRRSKPVLNGPQRARGVRGIQWHEPSPSSAQGCTELESWPTIISIGNGEVRIRPEAAFDLGATTVTADDNPKKGSRRRRVARCVEKVKTKAKKVLAGFHVPCHAGNKYGKLVGSYDDEEDEMIPLARVTVGNAKKKTASVPKPLVVSTHYVVSLSMNDGYKYILRNIQLVIIHRHWGRIRQAISDDSGLGQSVMDWLRIGPGTGRHGVTRVSEAKKALCKVFGIADLELTKLLRAAEIPAALVQAARIQKENVDAYEAVLQGQVRSH
ncbi:hypothetical protein QBC46DRAFT_410815 [Diplogelasinospora grovesii]|uniref:Uncharacterized protein n=1 Tax=Diplogelasinospora grovesii TaxID=303347 RepID=A0AAN6N256_9PEZI|nr:hypothetical protein QBC46DRAFT_410815 [Diplogelasinospora grovesii]